MAEILRVVSGPTASRTTVIDLLSAVNVLSNFSAPAPRLRRSSVSSFQADGSVDAATAWEDRELTITFAVQGSSEDQAAFVSQILGRTFARPCWLEFQGGTSKPVFFRTRATTLDVVEDFGPSNPGIRQITVVIPADPFAYGLPESGVATVPNDPTAAGGLRFTVSDVKGDLPAPLRLELDGGTAAGAEYSKFVVGSTTYPTLHHASVTLAASAAYGGWTISTVADATAIGGSYERASSTNGAQGLLMTCSLTGVEPGDYRLFLRMRSSRSADIGETTNFISWDPVVREATLTPLWQWVDMGVMRLPKMARRSTPWSPSSGGMTADVAKYIRAAVGSALTVDADHAVLVPAPGGDGSLGTLLIAQAVEFGAQRKVVLSGADEAAWLPGARNPSWSAAGGFPRVVPGASSNLVTIVRPAAPVPAAAPGTETADSKTYSTSVNWSYHPRYLTLRGD